MRLFPLLLATNAFVAGFASAFASADAPKTLRVRTPDGLTVAVQEWGNPDGPPVVFVHGLLQSHLSWAKQTGGEFAKRYRVITYDLRGHGDSDAPTDARFYRSGARWAGELRAVIRATGAKRPILVGWSLGGTVLSDYLTAYGAGDLGGLVYLDSWIKAPGAKERANSDVIAQMASPDLATRIAARSAFLRACFLRPPTGPEFEQQLAFNMLTPGKALLAMIDRSFDADAVARRTALPVLVYHGESDVLMPLESARHTAATFPHATLVIAKGAGHAPFFEDPAAFLGAFEAYVRSLGSAPK